VLKLQTINFLMLLLLGLSHLGMGVVAVFMFRHGVVVKVVEEVVTTAAAVGHTLNIGFCYLLLGLLKQSPLVLAVLQEQLMVEVTLEETLRLDR
jgi:hypothetical protein